MASVAYAVVVTGSDHCRFPGGDETGREDPLARGSRGACEFVLC